MSGEQTHSTLAHEIPIYHTVYSGIMRRWCNHPQITKPWQVWNVLLAA